MTDPISDGNTGATGPSGDDSTGSSGASGSGDTTNNNSDPGFQYVELPTHVAFDGSRFKWREDGGRVLTDFADLDQGDRYPGMTASARDVDAPKLDDEGNPVESGGDAGGLDDPGSMTQFHTSQRFPLGTRTVHKYQKTLRRSGHDKVITYWDHWEYQAAQLNPHGLSSGGTKGYVFRLLQSYTDDPISFNMPSAAVKDLATKGGYWLNGKKYS
jgi:hypothetical protein